MEFYLLTKEFYKDYANCKEILKKKNRPYTIYLLELNNLTFAIPMRHNISHNYSIKTFDNQGLDFTKAVVILKGEYVGKDEVHIDKEEYKVLYSKAYLIKTKLEAYIKTYKKAYIRRDIQRNKKLCEMSTLQYFHKELGIEEEAENLKKRIEEAKKATKDDFEVFEW